MKGLKMLMFMLMLAVTACHATQSTQVVYRFDDHRYLELTGYDCEGALWYTDTLRGIHSEASSQFYRIFTQQYIHPSEHYISIMSFDSTGFLVSKDYGQTWQSVGFSPGPNEPDGMDRAPREEVSSFTVVNDQGFLQTKHSLYMSSKPFEDPRILPGGPGIPYTLKDGTFQVLEPRSPGEAWGMVYMSNIGLEHSTSQYKTNWQGLPDKVPDIKNYQGWDHMRCEMDSEKAG